MNTTFALRLTLALAGAAAPAAAQISFTAATTHALQGQRPSGVAVLDLDGDGDLEFAVTSGQLQGVNGPEWVEVFANNGAGAFSAGQVLQVGFNVGLGAIAAGDLDGDGDTDLAVALENTNAVRVLVNTAGVLNLGSLAGLAGDEPKHLALGDVDGDGDLDVVVSNRSSDNLQIVTNAAGALTAGAVISVGSRPKELVLRDLNGDGRIDIAVAAQDSRRVDLLFGAGGGVFGAVQSIAMPFNDKPSGMAAGDLDGDGDLDLATTLENNGVGFAVVLRNTGGAFTAAAYATGSVNPGAIVIADLDVDGDLDLATADEDSNVVAALANQGLGTFGAATSFAVGAYPTALATGDLDGNASNDLVSANRDASTASVLRNALAGGPVTYCTSGVSVAGCQPTISASANPVVSHTSPCQITVSGMDGQRSGVLFYGLVALPQQWCGPGVGTSFLCVKAPTLRALQQSSGGAAGACNGSLTLDWNAFQLAQTSALGAPWSAGSKAYVQGWYRDPLSCKTTALSNAVQLTYQP
jgi:hypothetical protein